MGVFTDKGLQTPHLPNSFTIVQPSYHQEDKHHDNRHLRHHKQGVEVCHQADAFQVDGGDQDHKPDHPDPRWDLREQGRKIDFGQ
ncbi:hypothetical protein D3C76_1076740 [compost metagenome]